MKNPVATSLRFRTLKPVRVYRDLDGALVLAEGAYRAGLGAPFDAPVGAEILVPRHLAAAMLLRMSIASPHEEGAPGLYTR